MKVCGNVASVDIIEKSGIDFYLTVSIDGKENVIVQATKEMKELLLSTNNGYAIINGHKFKTMIKGKYQEFINITVLKYNGKRAEMVFWHGVFRLLVLGLVLYFGYIYSNFIAEHIHDYTGIGITYIKALLFIALTAFCALSKTMAPLQMAIKLSASLIRLKIEKTKNNKQK